MGTSRANISMIEKRARENVEKAKNTLRIYCNIIAPLKIEVSPGTDVLEIPEMVFTKSDEKNIHVNYNALEVIEFINKNAKKYIENRIVKEPFIINILENGDINIYPSENKG